MSFPLQHFLSAPTEPLYLAHERREKIKLRIGEKTAFLGSHKPGLWGMAEMSR